MKTRYKFLALTLLTAMSGPLLAQAPAGDAEEAQAAARARLQEQQHALEAARQQAAAMSQARGAEVEMRMREAERRLAEAARQVADLSMSQLPRVAQLEQAIRARRGPVLGVTIGSAEGDGPVEGVEILGVSPGGAADAAGLRTGDVITAINGEALTADSAEDANHKLLDFMEGVEVGDKLDVQYMRNGKVAMATVTPRVMAGAFAFEFDGDRFAPPDFPPAPDGPQFRRFFWMSHDDGFGDMELVPLTERLGSYFGTSEGLLVVRAPQDQDLKLEDGDVILGIDGRTPNSVSHAMRILGSYQSGEDLKIEIMRDKRKRTIELVIPDSSPEPQRPAAAPMVMPPNAVAPRTVVIEQDHT